MPMLVVDVIAIGLAFFMYLLWDKRPIKIRCEHCKQVISSETPWLCPACKGENTDTVHFPFMHQCKHCAAVPKAYSCHHCGELTFLSDDKDTRSPATGIKFRAVKVEPDLHGQKIKDLQRKKEIKLMEKEIALVESEREAIKTKAERAKPTDPFELTKQELEEKVSTVIKLDILEEEVLEKSKKVKSGKGESKRRRELEIKQIFRDETKEKLNE